MQHTLMLFDIMYRDNDYIKHAVTAMGINYNSLLVLAEYNKHTPSIYKLVGNHKSLVVADSVIPWTLI